MDSRERSRRHPTGIDASGVSPALCCSPLLASRRVQGDWLIHPPQIENLDFDDSDLQPLNSVRCCSNKRYQSIREVPAGPIEGCAVERLCAFVASARLRVDPQTLASRAGPNKMKGSSSRQTARARECSRLYLLASRSRHFSAARRNDSFFPIRRSRASSAAAPQIQRVRTLAFSGWSRPERSSMGRRKGGDRFKRPPPPGCRDPRWLAILSRGSRQSGQGATTRSSVQ